jgi:hypothetical protein
LKEPYFYIESSLCECGLRGGRMVDVVAEPTNAVVWIPELGTWAFPLSELRERAKNAFHESIVGGQCTGQISFHFEPVPAEFVEAQS